MKKSPAGGKYDPADPFCYFLATTVGRHLDSARSLPEAGIHMYPHVLVAVNEIETARHLADLDQLCDERSVLLDSGIYNLTVDHARRNGITMDEALQMAPDEVDGFARLYDRYCSLASTYADRLWGVIELDLGGPQVKPETHARVLTDTGVEPIPVIHPRLDGWGYYDRIAAEYDRVCVGNLVKAVGSVRVQLLHALSERSRRDHPEVWHHLLGVTPSWMTHCTPVRGSSDSSTWLNGARWMKTWRTNAMGRALGMFPADMWYSSGIGNYYRTDGVAYATAVALETGIRDVRAEYGSIPR